MLSENSAGRIVHFLAIGDPAALARYLVACLPAGGDLEPMREIMARWTPEFRAYALEVAPWLAGERLAHPNRPDPSGRILALLAAAGPQGVALSSFRMPPADRDQALEALIATRRVIREHRRTNGRPIDVYRLAEHARGVVPADHGDPFAFRPTPLNL